MFEKQTFRLLEWFEGHKKNRGMFIDNAHHPIWGVANSNRLPHTFHYYGIIMSYLNLHRRLKKDTYKEKAMDAANVLCSLQKNSGQFRFDTFEFNNRKTTGLTLIHNALPSIALLELYKQCKVKKYLDVARKNIAWFYCRLWNGKYLSGCVNQDVCAATALALLYKIEKNEAYKKRAERIANKMLPLQLEEGSLKGGFLRGVNEKDLIIPWYDALTAVCYLKLYHILGKESYKTAAIATAKFLEQNISDEGLVHWYIRKEKWVKVKKPLLIAPAGIVLHLFSELKIKKKVNLVRLQQSDGSFPNALGYTEERTEPNIGWNQFMLIYLTSLAEREVRVKRIKRLEIKEKKSKKEKEGIYRRIYALRKEGYVDVMQDHFVVKSYKIQGSYFKLNEDVKDNVMLRFRLVGGRWKTIRPNTRFLKVVILPYGIIMPYVIGEWISTRLLMFLFKSKALDYVIRIKVWRK